MIDLTTIDTIIFDLGGVVVDLDLSLTVNAFKELGIKDPEEFISHGLHSDIFLKLEIGEITEKEFYDNIRVLAGNEMPEGTIKKAWCAMLTGIPDERVRIIEKLKKEHKVILLSNTNSIHLSHFDGMAAGHQSLSELFDEVYYSFRLHDHKPNVSVFRKLIELEKIDPGKTLFVDDAIKNIVTARETGMHTMLVSPDMQMENIFTV